LICRLFSRIIISRSFLYGITYLSLTAYALIFGQRYGFAPGFAGLPYIGMISGVVLGLVVVISTNKSYVHRLRLNDNRPVPEWRLPLAAIGGVFFPIGNGHDSTP
jgi:DHA1 family multidrug resistance protein-like MFS transporter